MDIEYRQMRDAIGGDSGRLGACDVVLWQCGIGKVNAAVGTMRLIAEHHPDAIVSTGLAGGIDPQMRVMDVLAATQCVYHDVDCGTGLGCVFGQVQGLPPRFDADAALLDHAVDVAHRYTDSRDDGRQAAFRTGLICTGDQFITDRDRQNIIKRHFPEGLACDMESAAIAQTCYLLGVPFLSLRVISDTPGRTDNHQQQWEDFLASMCDRSFRFVKRFLATITKLSLLLLLAVSVSATAQDAPVASNDSVAARRPFLPASVRRHALAEGEHYTLAKVVDGDTIPYIRLKEVKVYASGMLLTQKEIKNNAKLIRNVKLMLPYAQEGKRRLDALEVEIAQLPKKQRKAAIKKAEQDLLNDYKAEISNYTFSQGLVLIKLIDRETSRTAYNIVGELRGSLRAGLYQTLAKLFGYNLKTTFDPKNDPKDNLIDRIVVSIERGQL